MATGASGKEIKRILVSLEIPDLLPWNRKSAVANVVSSFCLALHEAGYEVYLNAYPFTTVNTYRTDGAEGDATAPSNRLIRIFPKRFRELIKDILLFWNLRKQFFILKKAVRPDVVISWVSYGSAMGARLSRYWKVPLICIYDNPLQEEYTFNKGFPPYFSNFIERRERQMLQAAQAIIVYSHAVSHYLKEKYPMRGTFYYKQFVDYYKEIHVLPKEQPQDCNFVYVGSFFPWHKMDDLICSFEKVNKQYPHTHLYLVGNGPEMERIQLFARDKHGEQAITFTGYADDEKLTRVLQISDVAIIPGALWFHAPVKLFQYAANGLPIISVSTPTIKEITRDASDVYIIDERDNTEAMLIKAIHNKKDKRIRSGELTAWYQSRYSKEAYVRFFEQIFHSFH